MLKKIAIAGFGLLAQACQSVPAYEKTVPRVELQQFAGIWYVIASRPTFLERNAFNGTESYAFDEKTGVIDVDFKFNKGSFDGTVKSIPQKARVHNEKTNAHWKISMWWMPFSMDYLIIGLDNAYQWTVVGVPNQNYLWVMARQPSMPDDKLAQILKDISDTGYRVDAVELVPQQPLPR